MALLLQFEILDLFGGNFCSDGQDTITEFMAGSYGKRLFFEYDYAKKASSNVFFRYFLHKIIQNKLSMYSNPSEKVVMVLDEIGVLDAPFGMMDGLLIGAARGLQFIVCSQSLERLYGISHNKNVEHSTNALLSGFATVVTFHTGDCETERKLQEMFGERYIQRVQLGFSRREPAKQDVIFENCLSTGTDDIVHRVIRTRQLEQAYREGRKLVVLDATRRGMAYGLMQINGYHVAGTIPGNKQYFNIFEGKDNMVIYKFRKLLQVAGYSEMEIQKSLAYICFLQHVVSVGDTRDKLSVDLIRKFSSSMAFEYYVNNLVKNRVINQIEQMIMLSKYSELAAISIDLEATILNFTCVMGLGNTDKISLSDIGRGEVLYFHIGGYHDEMIRNGLLSMILFDIDESGRDEIGVFVLADGIRQDQVVSDFLEELPREVPCMFETSDIFAIEQRSWERMIDRFDICIFSKHASMRSCELCEQQFGTMEVYKNSYTADYDRHLRTFSFLDKILGKDKVEHYGKTPAWEPVHRKEDIYTMMPGMAIISFAGNSQLVQCNY